MLDLAIICPGRWHPVAAAMIVTEQRPLARVRFQGVLVKIVRPASQVQPPGAVRRPADAAADQGAGSGQWIHSAQPHRHGLTWGLPYFWASALNHDAQCMCWDICTIGVFASWPAVPARACNIYHLRGRVPARYAAWGEGA